MLITLSWKAWGIKKTENLPEERAGWSSGLDIRNRIQFSCTNSKSMHLRAGGNFYYAVLEGLVYKGDMTALVSGKMICQINKVSS